jgi:K(+)-stimulated pyrophosphate-energized sodium pump
MYWILYGVMGIASLSLIYSFFLQKKIMRLSCGNEAMISIATAIQEGAKAYLSRQYRSIFMIGVIIAVFLFLGIGPHVGFGFVLGAFLSGISGYIGMHVSVRANVRTAQAAQNSLADAFSVAFQSGSVTGFLVVGLGLLGVAGYSLFFSADFASRNTIEALVALSFGASLISIFARLGGGIFTKGADVGADLVGKLEAGIPEDDPRNAAVIADNVGDNVGDCAGMGADLFETYVVTLVASMQIAMLSGAENPMKMMMYPLVINAIALVSCLVSTVFVRLGIGSNIMKALYKGLFGSMILSAAGIFIFSPIFANETFSAFALTGSCIVGIMATGAFVWITEYYTSSEYRPVKSVALASTTGAGTNLIQGLAVSMESCFIPVLIIVASILVSYFLAGLFGVSLAATSMLSLTGMIVALDAYGPVTDNAGGIAEMAGLNSQIREITDRLDSVGNTTKAVTKGYAIGSAGLAALVLFGAYTEEIAHYFPQLNIDFRLSDPYVLIGLFLGGSIPYLFAGMGMKAVGRAAASIVVEVRRQFREIKGLMEGKAKPDYGIAVDILTKAAIKEMMLPSLLPVVAPIFVYLSVALLAGKGEALASVGGLLVGMIVTGVFVGLSMTNGGGAFDNAKKAIEEGAHGGKGSAAYEAAVVGDTVGDPLKDTSGPGINPLIKIANLVAILMLSFL